MSGRDNANRTAALKRQRRVERLGNAMLRILAAECDKLAKNPSLPFDASSLAGDPRVPKQLQATAPISESHWYRLKADGIVSVQTIQSDLVRAASEIVRERHVPRWIISEETSERPGGVLDDESIPPKPLSSRQIFEALALNGTVGDQLAAIDADATEWQPGGSRYREFWILDQADLGLALSASLIEQAARTLVREDQGSSDQARLERLRIHHGWLGQITARITGSDSEVLSRVVQAKSRVDGMIAGTLARLSVPRPTPLPEPLDAEQYGGLYAWHRGVIDMLVIRERFPTCQDFVLAAGLPDSVRRTRIDHALERLAIYLIDSPVNTPATEKARQLAQVLLDAAANEDEQPERATLTAYLRLRSIIQHYLNGEWAQVRAVALLPAMKFAIPEVQEGYNWPLQAALAREATAELEGDNSGSDDIGRYLSNYLHDMIKAGAGPLMDRALRNLAADSDAMPPPQELAQAIRKLVPSDAVQSLSDAVWALAIDRNFAGKEAERNERLRAVNYGQLAHDLWETASTLAGVAQRLQGLAAPYDHAPYAAEDWESPARIEPLLESLGQVWMKQPTTQLAELIKDVSPAFDPTTSRSPDADLFDQLQIRLGLLERTPPRPRLSDLYDTGP